MATSSNSRSRIIAGIIVAIGWAIAIPIIVLAAPPEDDPLGQYRNSKQYEASMERIGGKSAVFGAELTDFLTSLFQGARLGYTIGFAGIATAAVYLWWASLDPKPEDESNAQ